MGRQLSLHAVAAAFPNKDGRGDRRFEILICAPGELVALVLEPKNPANPNAVAVVSVRDVKIGYLSADRAAWIGSLIRQGTDVRAIFQSATQIGAIIRIGLYGEMPVFLRSGPRSSMCHQTTIASGLTIFRRTIDYPLEFFAAGTLDSDAALPQQHESSVR